MSSNPVDASPYDPNLRQSQFPRIPSQRESLRIDAIRRKLVEPIERNTSRGAAIIRAPDASLMQTLAHKTAADIKDVENLMQLLPDTELAMQILTSSILSPKDLLNTEIHYSVDGNRFTSELTNAMLNPIRDHFENEHKIIEVLPEWLKDALFRTGSYPTVILPESAIDDAINSGTRVSQESLAKEYDFRTHTLQPMGILGNKSQQDKLGLENLTYGGRSSDYTEQKVDKLNLSIVDNFNLLKLPILTDKIRRDKIHSIYRPRGMVSLESYSKDDQEKYKDNSVYRERRYAYTPVMTIRNAKSSSRPTFGHPLAMHLPSESVIPVHVPGNPNQHVAYFVVTDENGNPITLADQIDFYRQMGANVTNTTGNQSSNITADIRRIHASFFGAGDVKNEEISELERMYGDIVEQEMIGRLKAGVYGSDVEISRDPELYRIMFARACRNKKVQLLFIPEELLVYVAFDYNEYGIGQSLMSKSKMIAGMRAMLLLANTNGAMRNAIGRTDINITLDEHDPDPSKTVEFALHEYFKVNAGAFPLGIGNPQDLLNYLQRASIKVNVEGNERYPGTKFDVADQRSDKNLPDQEFQTSLKKMQLQSFGLSPEVVENSEGPDFATTITHNNLLMAKRIQMYANDTSKFLSKYARTYTLNSETLMTELRTIVKEGWEKLSKEQRSDAAEVTASGTVTKTATTLEEQYLKDKHAYLKTRYTAGGVDAVIMDFLTALKVSLPSPDTAALETQFESIETFEKALDKGLSYYINSTFLTSNSIGELSQYADEIKETLKAYYMRRYMRENNILPELDELTTFNDEDGPAVDLLHINEQHLTAIARSVLKYAQALKAAKDAQEQAVSALGLSGGGMSSTDTGTGDSSLGSSDGFGSDDFGADSTTTDPLDTASDDKDDSAASETSETTETTETSSTTTDADGSESSSEVKTETKSE